MSATMTAPEQIDGLEKLITLASLRKEDIIATQTEVRKQLQLTQEERGNVAAAKAYIAQHAALVTELQGRENELAAAQEKHKGEVSKFTDYVASENKRLEDFAARLNTQKAEQEAAAKNNANEAARLSGLAAQQTSEHEKVMANARAVEAANIALGKTLETERQRLTDWESVLKKKAQNLRDQAANF